MTIESAAAGETAVVKIGDFPLELQLKNIHWTGSTASSIRRRKSTGSSSAASSSRKIACWMPAPISA
jgi:hypothetical protein